MENNPFNQTLECLASIRTASEQLREALMKGRAENILQLVGEQENLAETLKVALSTVPPAGSTAPDGADPFFKERGAVREMVNVIRRIHRTNHALASAFCETIDRTIRRFCGGANDVVTYGANGLAMARVSPALVNQEG